MSLVWTIWTAWGFVSLPGPLLSCRRLRAHISPLLPPTSPHLTRLRGHPSMRQFMLSTGSLVYLISPPVVVLFHFFLAIFTSWFFLERGKSVPQRPRAFTIYHFHSLCFTCSFLHLLPVWLIHSLNSFLWTQLSAWGPQGQFPFLKIRSKPAHSPSAPSLISI